MWPPVTEAQKEEGMYYPACTQNMTVDNIAQEMRCCKLFFLAYFDLLFTIMLQPSRLVPF